MRLGASLFSVLLPAILSGPLAAQVQSESDGSFGSAVLGGLLGGYSGLMVSNLSSRHIFCPHRDRVRGPCLAPVLIGSALGLGAGAYAGAESSHRVKGAYVGAGLGALAGLVTFAVLFKSEFAKSEGHPTDPLFAAVVYGAAFGVIAGGIIAGDGDSNRAAATQQIPIGLRLSF
jgi:hypothetical protein